MSNKNNTVYSIEYIENDLKNILNSIEDFKSKKPLDILPLPNEIFDILKLLDKHKNNPIIIFDDKDFDGTISGYISYSVLKQLGFDVDIKPNTRHGVTNDMIQKQLQEKPYKLVIIVDSSTLLVEEYGSLNEVDILVIDHHIPDNTLIIPSNVILCNSKNTKGLECISAGMLCYIVFLYYFKIKQQEGSVIQPQNKLNLDYLFDEEDLVAITQDINITGERIINDESLFELACCSLYADIVPVDNTVLKSLLLYMFSYIKSTEFVSKYMEKDINKTNLSYNLFPLINYTRRLNDTSLISRLYQSDDLTSLDLLKNNHNLGKQIVQILNSMYKGTEYNNFILADITKCTEYLSYPIDNFKGLLCNTIHKIYNKPVITGIQVDKDYIDISVRSEPVNSLNYFRSIMDKYDIDGGGHNSACGFKINIKDLKEILEGYDMYLTDTGKAVKPVRKISIQDVKNTDWYYFSLLNELCYSDHDEIIFYIDDNYNYKNISNLSTTILIDNIQFTPLKEIDIHKPIVIYPMLVSADKKTYILMVENYYIPDVINLL